MWVFAASIIALSTWMFLAPSDPCASSFIFLIPLIFSVLNWTRSLVMTFLLSKCGRSTSELLWWMLSKVLITVGRAVYLSKPLGNLILKMFLQKWSTHTIFVVDLHSLLTILLHANYCQCFQLVMPSIRQLLSEFLQQVEHVVTVSQTLNSCNSSILHVNFGMQGQKIPQNLWVQQEVLLEIFSDLQVMLLHLFPF